MTRPAKTNLTLAEAEATLKQLVATPTKSASTEWHTLPLAETNGMILADDITASIDVPAAHVAAVDGFAFNHSAATTANFRLKIAGTARAGHPLTTPPAPATAIAITTGAVIPTISHAPDAAPDTIAMAEACQVSPDKKWVTLPPTIKPHSNFRSQGENIRQGDHALSRGHRLGAAEIGLAAALGLTTLPVMKPLTIGILSTGDELTHPDTRHINPPINPPINQSQIYDSNRPMLTALLSDDGHQVLDGGIAPDTLAATQKKYSEILGDGDAHALITTGGSAGSPEDYAKQAITKLGGSLDFWQLRIKPGRPFAFGRIGNKPVFCIPGNPVAVVVTYRLLVAPALMRLAGGTPPLPLYLEAISGVSLPHKPGRDDFVRATISHTDADYPNKPVAHPHGRFGAGILTSVIGADGLLHIPAQHGNLKRGDIVPFLPWRTP